MLDYFLFSMALMCLVQNKGADFVGKKLICVTTDDVITFWIMLFVVEKSTFFAIDSGGLTKLAILQLVY